MPMICFNCNLSAWDMCYRLTDCPQQQSKRENRGTWVTEKRVGANNASNKMHTMHFWKGMS